MKMFVILGGAIALVLASAWFFLGQQTYQVTLALRSANNIIEGGRVHINGFEVGRVDKIQVRDGQAYLTLNIEDASYAPLHEGADVKIQWKALLGERIVAITDGLKTNPEIPDGGTIPGVMPKPIEIDEVLNTLDASTLSNLSSLVKELDKTAVAHEGDMNATIQAAGPALNALGSVLDALGTDGPAIRNLVVRLNELTGTLANRQQDVRTVVTELSRLTALAADQQEQLREGLRLVPPTLQTARTTFAKVPGVVDEAVPLLEDLKPTTAKLAPFAANLRPLLEDLRPTVRELRPTLEELDELLDFTPSLLDVSDQAVPELTEALDNLSDPLDFLRPFTPEATAFLSHVSAATKPFDSNGHYIRFTAGYGAGTGIPFAMPNPGVMPPAFEATMYPAPGEIGGQPWTDAFGEGMR